ncbi:hypothetical protein [Sphingobium sp.]|uniref:hypothetical protein n=1 Tax=Sphingobium sp. TaxID=1912891 RepID=UPI003BB56B02
MLTHADCLNAGWWDVASALPGLIAGSGYVLEIDRLSSSLPPSMRDANARLRSVVIPPVSYAMDVIRRGITPQSTEINVGETIFAAPKNADYFQQIDPLSYRTHEWPDYLRGRTLDTFLLGIRDVKMVVIGGDALSLDMIVPAARAMKSVRPVVVIRSDGHDRRADEVIAFLKQNLGFVFLKNADLHLNASNDADEVIAVGRLDQRSEQAPPNPIMTSRGLFAPADVAVGLKYLKSRANSIWPSEWLIDVRELSGFYNLGPIESSDAFSWRWSAGNGSSKIYIEVPASARYEIVLHIPFVNSTEPCPQQIMVNGQKIDFIWEDNSHLLTFETKANRQLIIELLWPTKIASAEDVRKLGYAFHSAKLKRVQ